MAQPPLYPSAPAPEVPPAAQLYPTQSIAYPAPPPAGPPPTGPPPPYAYEGQAAPPPPVHHNVVVVQQKPEVQQQPKRGMFSSFMKEVDKFGQQLGKEVDFYGKKLNDAVDRNVSTSLMGIFGNYNVVQLIPRSTGKIVQILLNEHGHMILDGNGHLAPNANSLWTVINEGSNQVRLHNNNNYLAVIKGCTTIVPIVPGVTMGLETKFQLSQITSQYLTLESLSDREKFVAFYPTGQIKPACRRDWDCHFAVKLVSTAYPVVHPTK